MRDGRVGGVWGVAPVAAGALLALLATAGCGTVSGGRYRDALQKLHKERPATGERPTCGTKLDGYACEVLAPTQDASDLIGATRDVGALDRAHLGTSGEDRAYFGALADMTPYVDLARHGVDGPMPGVPFLFDISKLDPDKNRIEKARLTLHVVGANHPGEPVWRLARVRRGVVEAVPEPTARKGGALALQDATLDRNPDRIFEGLKYMAFTSKIFDGLRYVAYMREGLLDAKIEEAKHDTGAAGETYVFDVTGAFIRAQEDKTPAVVLILVPEIPGDGTKGEPTFLFVGTRAAAETVQPALLIEYPDPPEEPEATPPPRSRNRRRK